MTKSTVILYNEQGQINISLHVREIRQNIYRTKLSTLRKPTEEGWYKSNIHQSLCWHTMARATRESLVKSRGSLDNNYNVPMHQMVRSAGLGCMGVLSTYLEHLHSACQDSSKGDEDFEGSPKPNGRVGWCWIVCILGFVLDRPTLWTSVHWSEITSIIRIYNRAHCSLARTWWSLFDCICIRLFWRNRGQSVWAGRQKCSQPYD